MTKTTLMATAVGICLLLASCGDQTMQRAEVSGYDYEVYKATGGSLPNLGDQVYFQMDILDDKDSLLQSYRNQKVLPSITILDTSDPMRRKNAIVDVLSYMSEGDSVGVHIPTDSIPTMPPGFEDIEYLEYRLVTTEIMTPEAHQAKIQQQKEEAAAEAERLQTLRPEIETLSSQTLKDYKSGSLQLQTTKAGVKYVIHEMGTGDMPTQDRMLSMQYFGRTVSSGEIFDDSFGRGRSFNFRLGRREVIAGWDDAMQYFPVGTKASIFIPSDMGYGKTGSPPNIGPDEELYFYVEVEELFY
ncbi:MAG: FKBP-type peptidyl-prolyl cis-trans isomerase [Bacteroidota bacterium]